MASNIIALTLQESITLGFFTFSLLWLIGPIFENQQVAGIINTIDGSSVIVARIAGALLIADQLISVIFILIYKEEEERYAFLNRISGPYAWAYWMVIFGLFSTQFLWVSKLASSKRVRLIILILLFPVSERAIYLYILFTENAPASSIMYRPMNGIASQFSIFLVLVCFTFIAKKWISSTDKIDRDDKIY